MISKKEGGGDKQMHLLREPFQWPRGCASAMSSAPPHTADQWLP